MEKKLRPRNTNEEKKGMGIFSVIKYLLFSYILTGLLLLILAFLLYRFRLSEKIVAAAIIAVYLTATFLAGFFTGKQAENRKFLWGLLQGGAYFLILAVLSLAVNHSLGDLTHSFLTTFLLCAGGGMLGGMLS